MLYGNRNCFYEVMLSISKIKSYFDEKFFNDACQPMTATNDWEENKMPRDVSPDIFTNERDFPLEDYHCDDPEKAKLIKKLGAMITDVIPRRLPGGIK